MPTVTEPTAFRHNLPPGTCGICRCLLTRSWRTWWTLLTSTGRTTVGAPCGGNGVKTLLCGGMGRLAMLFHERLPFQKGLAPEACSWRAVAWPGRYKRTVPGLDRVAAGRPTAVHPLTPLAGVIGSRSRGGAVLLEQDGPLTAQGGFRLRLGGRQAAGGAAATSGMPATTHFVPPSLVW